MVVGCGDPLAFEYTQLEVERRAHRNAPILLNLIPWKIDACSVIYSHVRRVEPMA